MFLRLLIIIGITGLSLVIGNENCKMEDFKVKENFDEDKFAGKWYEASWVRRPWVPQSGVFHNYNRNYTKMDYGFLIRVHGRVAADTNNCSGLSYNKLYKTNAKGKYLSEYRFQQIVRNASFWIADTDYENYALAIGCRELAPNGTCIGKDASLWTRCSSKPQEYVTMMENKLGNYCITKEMLSETRQDEECSPDVPDSCKGGGSSQQPSWTILPVTFTAAFFMTQGLIAIDF